MAIGRNYRIEFETCIRRLNQSRERTLNSKIQDKHEHLIKPLRGSNKRKSKDQPKVKPKKHPRSDADDLVPLGVNYTYNNISPSTLIFFLVLTFSILYF